MREKRSAETSQKPILVGIDIGYGYTKAVSGSDATILPSVWGYATELTFTRDDILARYPGMTITDDEGEWFVGDLALHQVSAVSQYRLWGRTTNEELQGHLDRLRLLKVALGRLFPGRQDGDVVQMVIGTGLPVSHFGDRESLRTVLIDRHLIRNEITHFVADVVDVIVMPQPYGTLYTQTLQADGSLAMSYGFSRTGVVDVGTFTIDLAVDDEGNFISTESGSADGGMYLAQAKIEAVLEREMRQKPSYGDIEQVLRNKTLKIRGKEQDFSELVKEAVKPVVRGTLSLLQQKWHTGARLDSILLTGGGAPIVAEAVQEVYEQSRGVVHPQFANAYGYLAYGRWRSRRK